MHKIGVVLLIASIGFVLGCSSGKNLSREKAQTLITNSFAPEGVNLSFRELGLTVEESKEYMDKGFWTIGPEPLYSSTIPRTIVGHQQTILLTPLGQKYLVKQPTGGLTTAFKVHPKIEVTGISNFPNQSDETLKSVEYKIDWFSDFPTAMKPIYRNRTPEARSVAMQLYDDGWRLRQ